jgi:hypothetical protein
MTFERSRRKSSNKNTENTISDQVIAAFNTEEEETSQSVKDSSLNKTEENKTPDNTSQEDVIEKIQKELAENPSQFSASSSDVSPKKKDFLKKELSNKIIKVFADKSECTENLAVIGITALVQAGGTNTSMPPITKVINGKKFDLKVLRDCVAFVTEKKGTVRQLAKSMRNIIHKIALQNSWPGPLAGYLMKEYPDSNFTTLDLIAAAEFHEDNMESYMPSNVRDALVDRAKKLRAAKLQPKKTKTKKKGGKKKR